MASSSSSTERQRPNESGNAFEEIVPPSVTASSPSTLNKLSHDVFINHYGRDVKESLAKDIYQKFTPKGVRVFLDNRELQPGDSIPIELQKAMEGAVLHIAIFSENYAKSVWCLAELSCMVKTEKTIIPIFYRVKPDVLRRVATGNGIYASAIYDHEQKRRYSPEKIQEWKSALETVSCLFGYEVTNEDGWKGVLENLEKELAKVMNPPLLVSKDPLFGLQEKVEDFQTQTIGSASKIVGIVGMGGCGKTTLAKEVYNVYKRKYASIQSSFLYDVRDEASKNQLAKLQKKLLKDLGVQDEHLKFENVHEGQNILAFQLRSVSMFVVVDDVDHKDQIDDLLPPKDCLGPHSLIIITTRNLDVLTAVGIAPSSIYKMEGLDPPYARGLFCSHVFQGRYPPQEFEDLVEKSLRTCQGLPLSLKVLGGQLCHKPREYWESQLNEFSRVLPEGIIRTLKISYDALDPEEQDLFLDIACFFIKERKSLVIEVWDGLGQNGVYRLETLKNKCLVELDQENCIRMHDHLRDLGREIAKGKSPYRIWLQGQINNSSSQTKEELQIRGIMAATTSFHGDYGHRADEFCTSHYDPFEECVDVIESSGRCCWCHEPSSLPLKLLVLNNKVFSKKIGKLLKGLVWLRWFDFDHECLPSYLSLGNLRVLELYEVQRIETLWKNNRNPPLQLRELQMSGLQSLPKSIGSLKHLKKLVILCRHSSSVSSFPDEYCELESLENLELEGFEMLSSLPSRFGNLRKLRHVTLKWLTSLSCLPVSFGNLSSLTTLHIEYCSLECLPPSFGKLSSLTTLHIKYCSSLECLPPSFGKLSSLTTLHISRCERLESFPDSLGSLNRLEELNLFYSGVKSLPDTFVQLANLRELSIQSCPLRELTFRSGSLYSLKKISIYDISGLENLGISFTTISISEDCRSLETLYIEGSEELMEIETLPRTLKQLIVVDCPKLKKLPSFAYFTSLKDLKICGAKQIEKIENLEQMTSLETLRVKNGWKLPRLAGMEQIQRRLRTVELSSADNISALEPCIQTLKIWPCEMVIWGRAVDSAESIVADYTFPHLTVVHSVANKDISAYDDEWTLNCPKRCSFNAAIICVIFNCLYELCQLEVHTMSEDWHGLEMSKGKWIWIGIFDSSNIEEFSINSDRHVCSMNDSVIIEKEMIAVGEESRVQAVLKELMYDIVNRPT